MYATSMKSRLLTVARSKAKEIQEAAKPGRAVAELEDALGLDVDEIDDEPRRRAS